MHPNPDRPIARFPRPPRIDRRGFLSGCAAVAGAVLISSLLTRAALAHSPPPRATCVAIAEDGRALTSDDLGRLIAWDIKDPSLPHVEFARRHKRKAAYVATAGDRALTAGYDGDVIIHNLKKPRDADPPVFTGHHSPDGKREVLVAVINPHDGTQALSGANDGQILLWDPTNPEKPPREFPYPPMLNSDGPVAGLAFLPPEANGKQRFLSTRGFGDVHLWEFDATGSDVIKTFSHGNSRQVNAVVVRNDGSAFLSAGFDKTLRLWDPRDERNRPQALLTFGQAHKDRIWRVALSPTEKYAATASDDGTVRLWEVNQKQPIMEINDVGRHGSMGVAWTQGRLVYTLDGTEAQKDPEGIKGLIRVKTPPAIPEG